MEHPFFEKLAGKCVWFNVGEDSIMTKSDNSGCNTTIANNHHTTREPFDFCNFMVERWNELITENVLRYVIERDQPMRMLKTDLNCFLIQLNCHRFSNRRPPQVINSTQELFDVGQFNFTQIEPKEVVCIIDFVKSAPFLSDTSISEPHTKMIVAANVSPSNMYHYLIIPFPTKLFSQRVNLESLLVILQLYKNMDHRAFVGFNGLGAYASVNHLHFHLHIHENFSLPQFTVLESLNNEISGLQLIRMGIFTCLLFQSTSNIDENTINANRDIIRLLDFFTENNVPYNLAFGKVSNDSPTSDSVYMFIIPKNMNYNHTGKNEKIKLYPTFFEYLGVVTVGETDIYENITEDEVVDELQKYILSPLEICHLMAKFLLKKS